MKVFCGLVFFFIQFTFVARAQRVCGSVIYTQQLISADPSLRIAFNNAEAKIASFNKKADALLDKDSSQEAVINIPVVIHILYNTAGQNLSDAQILSQLTSLNNDFGATNANKVNIPAVFAPLAADTKIKFCIARVDPNGYRTNGIIRKFTATTAFEATDAMKFSAQGGDDAWDSKRYLNIWVCGLTGRTLGYASIPGSPVNVDGVVISYNVFGTIGNLQAPFNKGRTATHEVGHWFGLKHVWGDAVCGSDDVEDTPTQQYYNYGAPTFPHMSNCSPNASGDMFMNYMDFTDDGVMNMFTVGQKIKMRALFAKDNFRNSFLLSYACDSAQAQAGAPLASGIHNDSTATLSKILQPATKAFAVKIYPSPSISTVTIEYSNESTVAAKTVSVYNVVGLKVLSAQLSKEKTTLNISQLLKGIYIVQVQDGKNSITSKIIKQ